ncbi:MAG: cupin domain-containing protein, partial [Caulobacteraceae bacterium]
MSEEANPTLRPVSIDQLAWEEWGHGERYGGRVKRLGKEAGAVRVGVNLEELPPGKKSCPLHFHFGEEEQLHVLEGAPTLLLGSERIGLSPGDHVCFPAGQAVGHCLINETAEVCRFMMIGERNPHDVVVYPDSGKVLVSDADQL